MIDRIESILQDMEDSQVIMFSHHANDPNVGLSLHEDSDRYKLFLSDTGLFITLAFWDKDVTENVIYQKLLSDKLSAYLGYVYENTLLLARLDFVGGGFDSLFHFVELFTLDKHKIFVERTPLVDEQIVVGLADKHRAHLRSDADQLVG